MPTGENARPYFLIWRKIGSKSLQCRSRDALLTNNMFCPSTWIICTTSQVFHCYPLKDNDAFATIIVEEPLDTIFAVIT